MRERLRAWTEKLETFGREVIVEERQERHQAMLAVMRENSLERWRDRFEADLRGTERSSPS